MPMFRVSAIRMCRMYSEEIEADSEEDAKAYYTQMFDDGRLEPMDSELDYFDIEEFDDDNEEEYEEEPHEPDPYWVTPQEVNRWYA